jgi:DNA polymerase-3 subunit alpha
MNRTESKIPFVGLHAHSVAGSVFDGFGYPQDHMDFAYENGMSALALTDHGNMNGLSYQILHAKKMKASGKEFKPIFGVEAYFVPSVEEWKQEYEKIKQDKKEARKQIQDTDKVEAEDENATKQKSKSKINSYRHLVLIAMNQTGLNNIFKLVSDSHQGDNFYRKPRIDYKLLKKYGDGIIASSACLGGVYAKDYWNNRDAGREAVLEAMRETTRQMQDCLL